VNLLILIFFVSLGGINDFEGLAEYILELLLNILKIT
jgi:hypothetical protein